MSQRAAFFDVDRTLLAINSGRRYVRWQVSEGRLGLRDMARMSYWTMQYTLGVLDAPRVSRNAARTIEGIDEETYRARCADWVRREVIDQVTHEGRAEVARRRDEGYVCALLTTSSPYIVDPIAEELEVAHVLSSQLAVREGRFTGHVVEPLCYGPGKVTRAEAWAAAHRVDLAASVFYTDSISDLPMLERVGEARVINPDPRLRRVASRRGWPVQTWKTTR
ncbi:MAG: HAD family hydrolase [Sandaracinaceae bacterium]